MEFVRVSFYEIDGDQDGEVQLVLVLNTRFKLRRIDLIKMTVLSDTSFEVGLAYSQEIK